MKLFNYASPEAIRSWVVAMMILMLTISIPLGPGASKVPSWALASILIFGGFAAVLMTRHLVMELFPVAWSVVVRGKWPERK